MGVLGQEGKIGVKRTVCKNNLRHRHYRKSQNQIKTTIRTTEIKIKFTNEMVREKSELFVQKEFNFCRNIRGEKRIYLHTVRDPCVILLGTPSKHPVELNKKAYPMKDSATPYSVILSLLARICLCLPVAKHGFTKRPRH